MTEAGSDRRSKPAPVSLAMVLCDQILTDRDTNKHILVGTFSQILAPRLPSVHLSMSVFLALTEGRGEYNGLLRVTHVESNRVILEARGPMAFENPLQVVEVKMNLPPIRFEDPGVYLLELLVDGTPVATRKFFVRTSPEKTT